MARRRLARLWATLFAAQALFVGAVEVRFERVAENVYAHVGDIGVVVTPAGPVLIGPP